MKSISRITAICSLLMITIVYFWPGTASSAATATPRVTKATPQRSPVPSPATDWQKRWNDTVAAAKKEGELLIYLNAPAEARIALSEAIKKNFGITLNIVSASGADLANRLITEYRSGIHQVDVALPGTGSGLIMKEQGFLSPILPIMILPEITDPKVWFDQKLPMFDKDGTVVAYLSQVIPPVIYNTSMVKAGQITSYLDILKPEWKDKMVMYDPNIRGTGNFYAGGITQELGVEKANEYMTALIKQQNVMVTREMGQQMEWVTRGKYPLALFPQTPAVSQYINAGAPIAAAFFKEFTGISPSNGGLAIPKYPPHPNAATVFVNWFLSKEGQTVAVRSMAMPSMRLDVPAEGVNPMFVVKPGQKYFLQSENFNQLIDKWQIGWKKIFDQTRG